MKLVIQPGKYVVAVSGGVDSVVLLDLLRLQPHMSLLVAHYDHGIRPDSEADRRFVQALARRYGLPFVYDRGELGPGASEAAARHARYEFLRRAGQAAAADAIVMAHHQDDVLETAILNLLRGTGRKGLSSLTSGEGIIRPLLNVPKSELLDYARRHGIEWREDSTNHSLDYTRNYVRHRVLPAWSPADKARLLAITQRMARINTETDALLAANLDAGLERDWFIVLPHAVAREVIAEWLRRHGLRDFDRTTIERLTVAAKVAPAGKTIDIINGWQLQIGKQYLALGPNER